MNASGLIGLAAASVVTPALLADNGDALRARIAELEAQQAQTDALLGTLQGDLDLVRAESSDTWMTEARAEQVRGLVQDVLADADTRASLQGSGATSGYDKGFFIASPDGNFKLTMNANVQFRFAYDSVDQPIGTGEGDYFGFSNQRTALIFKGHAYDPSLTYFVQALWGPGYTSNLLDAWIGKSFDGGWKFRAGKFREPFMRETLVGYNQQLAVDRTLMQYYMGIGRSQGLEFSNQGDEFKLSIAAFESFSSIGGNAGLGAIGSTYDSIALAVRADWLAMGSWADVKNYTAFGAAEDSLLIGGAIAYATTDGQLAGTSGQQHDFRWTGDVTWNFEGGSLAAAVVMADIEENPTAATRSGDTAWGFNVQGAMFLDDDMQAFLRYEWADSMYDGEDDMSIVQAGLNYYLHGQNVKWSTDIGYSLNQLPATYFNLVNGGASGATSLTGWSADAGDGQWLIRSQLQLCF